MTKQESLSKKLHYLCKNLEKWHSKFPEQIDDICHLEQEFTKKMARLSSDNLHLNIGIIGQVKAGKSSFLNALLFDGKPVLPEAATPKTANLTRITFGETPRLSITYYSPAEWQMIEKAASSPSDHTEARIGRELLKMVSDHGINISSVLAKKCEHIDTHDVDSLMDKLNDYVGDRGRLTALVKMTDIQLPLDELRGIDVVDTPGMNDPVPSRTQKTREYMTQCDVVFFLSRCSQFLDHSDMNLLSGQLPGKGVKRMVLVAGQFDGAISDDGFDRNSLGDTEHNIKDRLCRRADNEIERLALVNESNGKTNIAKLLRGIRVPIFASTYAYGYATWSEAQWGNGMRHMHEQLVSMARNVWSGYQFTNNDWKRIGNFDALKAVYHAVRTDKQILLESQRKGLLPETESELKSRVERLIKVVENRSGHLRKGDVTALEKSIKECDARMAEIADSLTSVIDRTQEKIRESALSVQRLIEADINGASQLKTRTETKKEISKYSISTKVLYKPWTWFNDDEIIENTSIVNYEYLLASDAIEKIVNYSNESVASLQRAFSELVSLPALRTDLKHCLIQVLNTRNESFNPTEFRAILEGTLSRLRLPILRLELGDTTSTISTKFSNKIYSKKEINELRNTVHEAIQSIFTRLLSEFNVSVQKIKAELESVRNNLGNELAKDMKMEMSLLQVAFTNKLNELEAYAEILDIGKATLKSNSFNNQ